MPQDSGSKKLLVPMDIGSKKLLAPQDVSARAVGEALEAFVPHDD